QQGFCEQDRASLVFASHMQRLQHEKTLPRTRAEPQRSSWRHPVVNTQEKKKFFVKRESHASRLDARGHGRGRIAPLALPLRAAVLWFRRCTDDPAPERGKVALAGLEAAIEQVPAHALRHGE